MEFNKERNDALQFLREHPIGVLATRNADGSLTQSAIYFSAESDFTCYTVTKVGTRKFANMDERQEVSLYVFEEKAPASIELAGIAAIIGDGAEAASALAKYEAVASARKPGYWLPPIAQINAGDYVVYKILPASILYRVFSADGLERKPEEYVITP